MKHKRSMWLLIGPVAAVLVAACGGDDDTTTEPTDVVASTDDQTASDNTTSDLADVCPSPLAIQTDWFPEAEHGALYELMGDDYTVDSANKIVTASLTTNGGTVDTGIDWEVRTGGPAIGYSPVSSYVYTDDDIHLAYQNTEAQVLAWDATPMVSVVAPLEKNPQMIMWDPDTYPDIETLADLGEENVTINVFGGGTFSDVFVAQGIWSADQVDPSYNGTPGRFIADGGAIAQQGFASAEPYNYENVFDEWGKPVNYELLHDAGFEVYSQTIAVRPDMLDDLTPCLEQIVPLIQQAVVDYANNPDRANSIIIDAVEQFDSEWVYTQGIADYAVTTMTDLGLHGNGPDDTAGNMDQARIQSVIDAIRDAGLEVPDDLDAPDLFTNEFIDDSIGLTN